MESEIDKKSIIAVALLGIGMLLLANPAYTQGGSGGGTNKAEAVELNLDEPSAQELGQLSQISLSSENLPNLYYNVRINLFEGLNGSQQDAFLTGRDGIYTGNGQNAVGVVFYQDSVYLGSPRQTEVGPGFVYQEVPENDTFLISRDSLNGTLAEGVDRAIDGESVVFDRASIVLSGYDYVVDDGFYAIETSAVGENQTVLNVTQATPEEVLGPLFTPLEEVEPRTLRESLIASIDEPQFLEPNVTSQAEQYQFVSHNGTLYQVSYERASVPITDALSVFNFAGMGLGLLLMLGGFYMMREVYKEKTKTEFNEL